MNREQRKEKKRKEKKRKEKSEERRTKEKTGIEVWPKRGKNRKESRSKVSESSQDQAVVLIRSGVKKSARISCHIAAQLLPPLPGSTAPFLLLDLLPRRPAGARNMLPRGIWVPVCTCASAR
jgi:hypothetical protein